MSIKTVSIFYLSIGSGHRVAAEAVAHSLAQLEPQLKIHVSDPFIKITDKLPALLDQLQAMSILITPGLYDSLWRRGKGELVERFAGVDFLQSLLMEEILEQGSDAIVATHVLPCSIAATGEVFRTTRRVYGIVTDYGLNPLWPIRNVDTYFVGHREVKNTLVYRGVAPKRIHVSGIPIHPNFAADRDEATLRPGDQLKILIVLGGIGKGAYASLEKEGLDLIEALTEIHSRQMACTVITGHQTALHNKLMHNKKIQEAGINILGFVSDMQSMLGQHDLLITKPGGLITSEALACGIGLVIFKPGPGQETANAEFLARHGVALRGESLDELVAAIGNCLRHPDLVRQMKSRARKLGQPLAAQTIAQAIMHKLSSTSDEVRFES